MTRVHAVIPAAGRGVRFGSERNKVLLELHGQPIIRRAAAALAGCVDTLTVVGASSEIEELSSALTGLEVRVVEGASTRQGSVWNGLKTIKDEDAIVLIHDGARPLVSLAVIERCIRSAVEFGSGVAALPIVDALKLATVDGSDNSRIEKDIDRDDLWAVQTPQAFDLRLLRLAHQSANALHFCGPDEASLVQRLPNSNVRLVLGDRQNIKITTREDLLFVEKLAASSLSRECRVGIGYDIHRLAVGRGLWLGGVEIPSPVGLDGHSDADVVLHAICDSLLGAAGLLDIGHYFSNTDPAYRNISSLKLLASVSSLLREQGWSVGNIDTMLIAERPKIAPYIPSMRSAIANVLDITADRVSVKATTNEGIGSLGAGDGIACHASATIFR